MREIINLCINSFICVQIIETIGTLIKLYLFTIMKMYDDSFSTMESMVTRTPRIVATTPSDSTFAIDLGL